MDRYVAPKAFAFAVSSLMILSGVFLIMMIPGGTDAGTVDHMVAMDPLSERLVSYGYRPRLPYAGSQFIQTPSPAPEGAVVHPYGWTPPQTMSSPPSRATWTEYYSGTVLTVYVDTSSGGGGSPTSQEQTLLDAIIADFNDYTFPRVKDWYDPQNKITEAVYYVYKIDGPSGTGGYYVPGTDQFYVDRDDMSWAGEITAHEFQHYVHDQYDMWEDLWINEGCADYAAYLVYGFAGVLSGHLAIYLDYYPQTTLPIDDYSFQADGTTRYYGIAFAYQLYMTYQYGDKNWSRALIRSQQSGSSGVNSALSNLGESDRFQDSYQNWMVASRLNDKTMEQGQYSYEFQSYPYGSLRTVLMASYNSFPVSSSKNLLGWGPQSFRFTAPGDADTFRLKMSVTDGDMIAAFFPEKSSPPRNVTFIATSGGSVIYDFTGWGNTYGAFQLIVSSSAASTLNIDLDILDLVPPVTTYTVSPSRPDGIDGWYTTAPWVTLKTEFGATKYYSLDGAPQSEYTAQIYVTDGLHNLTYWSVDSRGNVESHRYLDFKVDTQVPMTSVDVDPDLSEDQWYTETPSIAMHSTHPHSKILFRWDQGPFINYTSALSAPEGEHTLYWKAYDQAGNEEKPVSRVFKVDTVIPIVAIDVYPAEPDGANGWYLKGPVVSLSGGPSEVLYYAIDTGEYSRYMAPVEIPEGTHSFRATSVDQAGNDAREVSLSFKVDTLVPEVMGYFQNFAYNPGNASLWYDADPILTLEGSEKGMTLNYSINGGPAQRYMNPLQFEDGTNEVYVNGEDQAGNAIEEIYYLIKIDRKAPNVEANIEPGPVNGWYTDPSSMIELRLPSESEKASKATIRYQWNDGDMRTYKDPLRIQEGSNKLTYYAIDEAGNEMDPKSLDIKRDTVEPDILIRSFNTTVVVGDRVVIDMSGSSDGSTTIYPVLKFNVDFGDGTNLTRSTPAFDHVYLQPGSYTITAIVTDAAGNSARKEISITVLEKGVDPPSGKGDSNIGLIIGAVGAAMIMLLILIGLAVILIARRRSFEVSDPVPVALPPPVQATPQKLAGATANSLPPPPGSPVSEE
jgi:hypothetical protein